MHPKIKQIETPSGIMVSREIVHCPYHGEQTRQHFIDKLDYHRGVLLFSDYEYPDRYKKWDIGFIDPPLQINGWGYRVEIVALNERGKILLKIIEDRMENWDFCENYQIADARIDLKIKQAETFFPEEERSKQNSVFTLIRKIIAMFKMSEHTDSVLGLYGALGYNLTFQFESLKRVQNRDSDRRDLSLYFPDRILLVDHGRRRADWFEYDFSASNHSTEKMPRGSDQEDFIFSKAKMEMICDHKKGDYIDTVVKAKQAFKVGDLFETVPGVAIEQPINVKPSVISHRLSKINPSPFEFFMNLGAQEYLVGASPEMFVRVKGKRIETCPISGTVKRAGDPMGDAKQILHLLKSEKEESELTMCTDVDRNDKARICEAGSVKLIGRRQIEIYSHLIHTVDYVEGTLREEFDALDAFLSHTWAVTVTGAPKKWAMQFIENHEKSPRHWYGGAVGELSFNGNINTGLALRMIQIKDGIANVRAGATLLYDSDPQAEEQEIMLKSAAMLKAISKEVDAEAPATQGKNPQYANKKILLVDHEDSFVHMLADYFRQTGAQIQTVRFGDRAKTLLGGHHYDLVVLSPGPGKPSDFDMNSLIKLATDKQVPIFGICLGLQAIGEYFGAKLAMLDYPIHGKPTHVILQKDKNQQNGKIFAGIEDNFTAARYHSIHIQEQTLPNELEIKALSQDGIIMAIEHQTLPIWAVQFHPESILTLQNNIGLQIIHNIARLAFEKT